MNFIDTNLGHMCSMLLLFFALVAMSDILLVSIFFNTIPILPPPFLCMGKCCLQMMDHLIISESLQVISITPITQELIEYEAISQP